MTPQSWGIKPDHKPVPWWGCRAIYHPPDGIDRGYTSREGDDAEVKKLCEWLDTTGLGLLKERLKKEYLSPEERREVRVEEGGFVLVANPNQSYGYLYLGAWKES